MSEPGPFAQALGQLAFAYTQIRPLVPTYSHLVVSALFPIYAGAHASLSRPSSAAKPIKRRKSIGTQDESEHEDEDDEDEDQIQRMEGLSPSDALMFPVLAGCTLAGLYFLIKWLKDPEVLNNILNWYFAAYGVLSVAKLIADALAWANRMIFPNEYIDHGALWRVKSRDRRVTAVARRKISIETRKSPLPGSLCQALPLPERVVDFLWTWREISKQKWTAQCYIQHIMSAKTHIGIHGGIGAFVALAASMYYNLVDKPWWLTNLFGFGFCYGAIQLMSPTTFATGALMLSALFFYDVYFVFYTPMMITVAKSLDIPIKLLFPRPSPPDMAPEEAKRLHAMLGLGDIVLPGIMIGLALRFDLFMHYLSKQKVLPPTDDGKGNTITKAPYHSMSGKQGDVFWTHSFLTGRSLLPAAQSPSTSSDDAQQSYSFAKPYFNASIAGYIAGLLTTLAFMHIYEHGQPALLYLVPGVLGSLFLTGMIRGELKQMWNFTEAEEEEEEQERKADFENDDGSQKSDDNDDMNVKAGKPKKKVLVSFSVSKRDRPHNKKTRQALANDAGDGLRRSPRLKTADGEPPHKMRRVS